MSTVNPASASVRAGGTLGFTVAAGAASRWSLEPATGPGKINESTGVYSAPCRLERAVSVCVIAADAAGAELGRATLNVLPPEPPTRSLSVVPDAVELSANQQVAFRIDPSGQGVIWQAAVGAIESTGVYTAPDVVDAGRTVVVTAYTADGAHYGTANVRLLDSAYWIAWLGWFWILVATGIAALLFVVWPKTVTPPSALSILTHPAAVTLNVERDTMQAFTADVRGVEDGKRGVAWSVTGPGKIDPATGVYTTENADEGTVCVTATSKEDSNRSNTATVVRAKGVSLAIQPSTQSAGPHQRVTFTADLKATAATPLVWSIAPNRGTIVPQDANGSKVVYEAPPTIDRTEVIVLAAKAKDGPAAAAAYVVLTGPPDKPSPGNLLLLAILMGSLGATLHAIVSLTAYVGSNKFVSSWFWWYIFRPIVGGVLALLFYFLIALGKIGGTTLDPSSVALLCGLVGMFADKASTKLSEVFDALIGPKSDPRANKLTNNNANGQTAGTPAAPTISSLTPNAITAGQTPAITIAGTNFRDGATVLVKSVSHPATDIKAASLKVQLTAAATAAAGSVDVVVVNADGTKSAAATLTITAASPLIPPP